MASSWHIVAFPLILPWREEFWTLPLYFPDLKVGVTPGWPEPLPYRGMSLPPEAEVHPKELQHYHTGDLRQWQAFDQYRRDQEDRDENVLRALRTYGQPPTPEPQAPPANAWSLAWQLEKMQADQEAQLLLVDKGHDWLQDIFAPEPWTERQSYGPVNGVSETVDPELAQLRYRLWRRVLAADIKGDRSAPLLLGRTARPLFLTLKGWPAWHALQPLRLSLPGCRTIADWRAVSGGDPGPPWRPQFADLLAALLSATADAQELPAAFTRLQKFVEDEIVAKWPLPEIWPWDLEIWSPDATPDETGPVLCWPGAGAGILPG